jgi:hypothetical protein
MSAPNSFFRQLQLPLRPDGSLVVQIWTGPASCYGLALFYFCFLRAFATGGRR